MNKKIISILLTVILFIYAIPMESEAYTGDIPGVDYTRIETNSTFEKEVTFVIGPNRFTGTLTNGQNIEDDMVDQIIRQVMKENSVTSEMLKKSHRLESQALEYNEDMYTQPRIFLECVLSAAGLGSAEELSMLMTGDGDAVDVGLKFILETIRDTAMNKLFSMALNFHFGPMVGTIIGSVKDGGSIAFRELKEFYQGNRKAQRAFAAALALEEFYAVCNSRIKEEEKKQGKEAQWRLKCLDRVETETTLFNSVTVPQYWDLAVDLTRTSAASKDPNDWGGTYEGVVQLNINHMMQKFDQQFKDKFFMSPSLPFVKASGFYIITDNYSRSSILKKQLRNANFKIQISSGEASNGQLKKNFSLNGFEDTSDFWSYHPIQMGLEYGPMHDGVMDIYGGGGHVHTEHHGTYNFLGDLSADNMGISMDMYGYDWQAHATVTAPYLYEHSDNSYSGSDTATIASDNTVFKDLLGTKEIIITGIK